MRLLLIFIALAVIVMVAKRLLQGGRTRDPRRLERGNMVKCATCGTYVPEADATRRGEHWYCNDHRDTS